MIPQPSDICQASIEPKGCLPEDITPAELYQELRGMAGMYLADESNARTLQPTALIHEAFLRVVGVDGQSGSELSKADFFARAAECMRRVLIDHARKKRAQKRTPPDPASSPIRPSDFEPAIDVLELDEALKRFVRVDPRAAEVVRLRFFMGLSMEQTAKVMGISKSTAEADWRVAKAFLKLSLGHEDPRDPIESLRV